MDKIFDRINELIDKPTSNYTQLDIDSIIKALNYVANQQPQIEKELNILENDIKLLEAKRTLELKNEGNLTELQIKSQIMIEKQDLVAETFIKEFLIKTFKYKYEVLSNKLIQVRQYLQTEIKLTPTL